MRILLLICCIILAISAGAKDLNWKKLFENCDVEGSITLYDYKAQKWISSDISDSRKGTLPASTFKIMNTLIALETGVVKDENEIIRWHGNKDTVKYGFRSGIYHDMDIKEAFKRSAGWVYVELAKKIGKERYRQFLKKSDYGNDDLSIDDPDFWNYGGFKVTPVSQVEMLIGVYEESLPFSGRSFKILKEMMIEKQTDEYILRAKTGWTRDSGTDTGWWTGYVETADNVYFFATRIQKDRKTRNPDFGSCRKEITLRILKQ